MSSPQPPKPSLNELPWVLESLLFVADEPQTLGSLARAAGVGEGAARRALQQLAQDYGPRGIRLQDDGQKYQLVTAPENAPYVGRLLGEGTAPRLSRAALEVLSIIAYKQPCTRAEVEAIRGVNCDKIVASLEQRELVEEAGYATGAGRSKLYRTTPRFFEHFGLSGPGDLPPLPDDSDVGEEVAM